MSTGTIADAGAIVLAGGRSSRMGSPKAALDWHGSTLLRRVTGLAMRTVGGPVVAVRAPGQPLPELDPSVVVVSDALEGRGPMQGLAAGLEALSGTVDVAYLASTDVPFLHPAFIRRVLDVIDPDLDVVLPEINGHHQPVAAAYRVSLLEPLTDLIAADRLAPASLYAESRVLRLGEEAMLSDTTLARLDPDLASVDGLNEPGDYERALAVPAPAIRVERAGLWAPETVPAWTLGELATAIALPLGDNVEVALNGRRIIPDPEFALATGDTISL